jgi:ABC-2 type transport system ATP-binding protein
MPQPAIKAKQIDKSYGRKPVLQGVTFSVQEGTIHGFVGPNGAGKSTTLEIATRLVLPTAGEIFILGKSVLDDPSFNEYLGFVPAESHFPAG